MVGRHSVIVIGGGHAGVEAAWAAANLLPVRPGEPPTVALVTADPTKIGVMSCNPAIGGLAKGQIVREIDALGGLMGLATDATGIQFKVLNTSKGEAVHGPRAQCDKHAYARAVQALIASRPEIQVIAATVEHIQTDSDLVRGVEIQTSTGHQSLAADAIVLTTGTFMRALMHCGEHKAEGGRYGEHAAVGIAASLRRLGFELGRLKTGTPPRLRKGSIRWAELPPQLGDASPVPFSDLTADTTAPGWRVGHLALDRFPLLPQIECRQTSTNAAAHDIIRANLHRAPMFSGQIESVGPRYCPSIEDKVVRFAERETHGVFLEPESLEDDWIYCNGISTSLPADVQDAIVRAMPGCENAEILRYGYAVEYDMVRPHQIYATGMTKPVRGLFLAGQINGTSGYEEAAGQGLIAGINAARLVRSEPEFMLGRDQAYIGVMMDDLVTKTPVEPYRMFTSRAEHRLLLRSDNAADRLTPVAIDLGLLSSSSIGRHRQLVFGRRCDRLSQAQALVDATRLNGQSLDHVIRSSDLSVEELRSHLVGAHGSAASDLPMPVLRSVLADRRYAPLLNRQRAEIRRHAELESRRIPPGFDFTSCVALRNEARHALDRFRPATFGQAARLEGVTPADITLLSVLVERSRRAERPTHAPVRPREA
ncbi:MAG: tRNA uridine-5-carboxymethylaminomethyl(34) synthesis enzyme MnmG [Phycisphaeraceae bacterium]|nr:tRNA uridine-5-carboxymethylaminomethyl(34) synthesis enzyme MnmG [Phycisphaeraceae bacterium]MBX3367785.1 tRNA uridine-5-carboxymethylaminomethyl(34) synthesis enzyme MnmG [Phycisphaeraceae bacterium]